MKVTLIENGPIILETTESITVQIDGESEERKGPLFLCRCGQSSTKPFCDAAHRKAGFEAAGAELVCG